MSLISTSDTTTWLLNYNWNQTFSFVQVLATHLTWELLQMCVIIQTSHIFNISWPGINIIHKIIG